MRPIAEHLGEGSPAQQGGQIAHFTLARVEQVTGVPDGVVIALCFVILVWAVLRAARTYGGTLGGARGRDGDDGDG